MTQNQMLILAGVLLLVLAIIVAVRMMRNPTATETPAPPEAAPLPETPPAYTPSPFLAAPEGQPDDLGRIKGLGPKLQARLQELGVFHYRKIAQWTPAQLALVDAELGQFQGRPERDQWQAQAALLASGDVKAYERAHGKLGGGA